MQISVRNVSFVIFCVVIDFGYTWEFSLLWMCLLVRVLIWPAVGSLHADLYRRCDQDAAARWAVSGRALVAVGGRHGAVRGHRGEVVSRSRLHAVGLGRRRRQRLLLHTVHQQILLLRRRVQRGLIVANAHLAIQHPTVAKMHKYLLDGAAALLLQSQELSEHAQGFVRESAPLWRHRAGPPPLPAHKLLVESVGGHGLLPGEVPRQHAEEQHSEGPHVCAVIHAEALVLGRVTELGRRVRDGAAHTLHRRACAPRHAEVWQLDLATLLVKD